MFLLRYVSRAWGNRSTLPGLMCMILYVLRAYGNRLILQGLMCVFLSIFAYKAQGNRLILQGLMCIFLFRSAFKAQGNRPRDPARTYVYIPPYDFNGFHYYFNGFSLISMHFVEDFNGFYWLSKILQGIPLGISRDFTYMLQGVPLGISVKACVCRKGDHWGLAANRII